MRRYGQGSIEVEGRRAGAGAATAEARLLADVSGLLPPSFGLAVRAIGPVDGALYPEENAHVAGAAARRLAEFGTARVCAREALAQLGFAPQPLVPNEDRSPVWPAGAVGSITHAGDYCAVAVARTEDCAAVGLDVEEPTPLAADLLTIVCSPAERDWLSTHPPHERGKWAKLFFSAKEAYYKCQFGATGRFLEFHDVELMPDPGAGRFHVVGAASGLPPALARSFLGRFAMSAEAIIAVATLGAKSRYSDQAP